MTIHDILHEIRLKSTTEKEKGTDFERLMKLWFMSDPRYNFFEKVWLWEEFPARKDFGGKDLGIDLVARCDNGDYYAIQCKCYAEDAVIDKPAVDSFIANASRTFTDPETFQTREFTNLIWVQTSRRPWGENANLAIQGLSKQFNKVSLTDLEISSVDWAKLKKGLYGAKAQQPGKKPMEHQLTAISKAYKYFVEEGHDRGKLIMACGTGKTFTSLRIMEQMVPREGGLVLFMVPSIALLGQTLNAWMTDKQDEIKAVCVCSDRKATKEMLDADEQGESVRDLARPACTNVKSIASQLRQYAKAKCRTVIFSTYQSIDVVMEAMQEDGREIDLIICDEAHRTTGVILKEKAESNFIKIHFDKNIRAKKRLYMTATPRLYRESVKVKAKQDDKVDELCSMDDVSWYGEEFHRLSFSEAVSKGLLADYKVLVLTVSEEDIPQTMRNRLREQYAQASEKERPKTLQFDDATKIIGCINGLSKRIKGDGGVTKEQDPLMMRRAVAFCQTIRPTKSNPYYSSTQIAENFGTWCEEYKETIGEEQAREVVNVKARHIDGSMDAAERNDLIAWLKEDAADKQECRVLCNVRCLSEGVDVPALDAVLFLSPRNSEVEVVQSVGRVMRTFKKGTSEEKKYGYIIIPVIVPSDVTPEQALNDNERFRVVWTILNALRSHDEKFNAHVNQIKINNKPPKNFTVGKVPPTDTYSIGGDTPQDGEAVSLSHDEVAQQLELRFGSLQEGIYARLVEKVGDKMYWENWAKSIGDIATKFIERIALLIKDNENACRYFDDFLAGLQRNINDSIDRGQAIEMLAQHMITRPVFDALFKDYQFVKNNPVSRSMQDMLEVLESEGLEIDTGVLEKFYNSVRINISEIENLEGKQTIIKNLYEKFFKGAFPLTVEKLGIVYTPVECVDFIIHSVEDILQSEFGTSLTEDNVHILDPFTGTGTFITRLLQSNLIRKEDMLRKYQKEIHCNEIVLLAYYIADVNIEAVFHDIMKPDEYHTYDGICLTDTFQLNEHGDNDIFSLLFPENSERLEKQRKAPVRVIVGNPPYSVGQKSANDNAQNIKYQHLETRIEDTYSKFSTATNAKSLYDSYIKAFRWASDRIESMKDGGIVAFISNGAWLDGNAQDGMRKCIREEFSSIYIFNLRGNQRTSGELSRKEGGKIFGSGSRTPIAITILVKKPNSKSKGKIYYYDIGDYLTQRQKLDIIKNFHSISGMEWKEIEPNEKNDWINQRDGYFDGLIAVSPEKDKPKVFQYFFSKIAIGVATNRDAWNCNFSKPLIAKNIQLCIEHYNEQRDKYHQAISTNPLIKVEDFVNSDSTKISWTRALRRLLANDIQIKYDSDKIFLYQYRPFQKQLVYYERYLVESPGIWDCLFPKPNRENKVICYSCAKTPTVIITDCITDLHFDGDSQCFPLYWYEKNNTKQLDLFDNPEESYTRRDGITDWILKEVRSRYGGAKNITKEMIFYYVYGLLHSPDYRERFAADLKKSLPRIPIVERVEDFMDFSEYGRKLAKLHLDYENVPPCPGVVVNGDRGLTGTDADYDYFRVVDKMRFRSKTDKSCIIYNGNISIENIPQEAYEYVVNGKSAIEWIVERYCIKTDPKSLIKNDANDWGREHQKPRYILDLLLSVINVSVQTVDIVKALPKLKFD